MVGVYKGEVYLGKPCAFRVVEVIHAVPDGLQDPNLYIQS
jgi:hypothetical protein